LNNLIRINIFVEYNQYLYVNRELSKAFSENNQNQAKVLLSKAKFFTTLLEKIKNKDEF